MSIFRLAQLSDLHLGPLPLLSLRGMLSKRFSGWLSWQIRRHRQHRTATIEALLADMAQQRVDHVAVTGDLVNISLPFEFARAGKFLATIGPPEFVALIPGNHDAYLAGVTLAGWASWKPYMGGCGDHADFPFVHRLDGIALIGLSSAVPRPPGIATGELGVEQLRRLGPMLAELGSAGLARVVMVHHPPVAGWSLPRKRLEDAPALRQVIAEHGAELVLCGHEHVLNIGTVPGPGSDIPVLGAPSASLLDHRAKGRHIGRARGGYLIHALERRDDGWHVATERRHILADGTVQGDMVADSRVALPASPQATARLGTHAGFG